MPKQDAASINREVVTIVAHLYSVTSTTLPILNALRSSFIRVHQNLGIEPSAAIRQELACLGGLIEATNEAIAMADTFMDGGDVSLLLQRKPETVN